jgi:hypothetical protein
MVNHLYYYGTFFLLGLSTIYLVRKINPKASILDYIICTIITVVSPLIYPIVIIGGIEEMYSLAFVNFALGFLFNFKDTTRITWKNVTILSFVLLSLNVYLQTYILFVSVLLLYFLIFHLRFFTKNWFLFVKIGVYWLGLNLFWLIVPAYNFLAGTTLTGLINYDAAKEGVANMVTASIGNQTFYPFTFYNNIDMVKLFYGGVYILVIQLILFCVIIAGNFISRDEREDSHIKKIKLFLLGIIVLFYIFSMGLKGRWQDIFLFFWNHVPLFNTYRLVFKFLFPIFFAFLILLTYSLKQFKKLSFLKLLLVILLIPTLLVFLQQPTLVRTKEYKIPEYYDKIEQYFQKNPHEGYIKIIPDESWYSTFSWTQYAFGSVNILPFYINGQVLYNFATQVTKDVKARLNDTVNEMLLAKDTSAFGEINPEKLIDAMGITTIILQRDTGSRQPNLYSLQKPQKLSYLKLDKTFGELDVYKNISPYVVPLIYPASYLATSTDDTSRYQLLVSAHDIATRSAIIFLSQYKDGRTLVENFQNRLSVPDITFQTKNPTTYLITVRRATGPFVMIFNQSYHWGWSLKGIKATHFEANGYANAWLIEPERETMQLHLEYKPQKIFMLGLAVSSLLLLLGCFFIFRSYGKDS